MDAPSPLLRLALARADDALVLGHRLSEWCGHAPMLEEDLALANIALDLIGQARALYGLAAEETGSSEDELAYFRDERGYRNLLLAEQPNGDFAQTIVRQFLHAAFADPWWRAMARAAEPRLAAIAAKAEKETAYHLRHAADWLVRLGDGTAESHRRAQAALDRLWPLTDELFEPVTGAAFEHPPEAVRPDWDRTVAAVLARATLAVPAQAWMQRGGREGRHTEHLGHLLAEMQSVARAHPGRNGERLALLQRAWHAAAAVCDPEDPGADHRRSRRAARRAPGRRRRGGGHHPHLHRLPGDGRDRRRRACRPACGGDRGPCQRHPVAGLDHRLDERGWPPQARRIRHRPARPRSRRLPALRLGRHRAALRLRLHRLQGAVALPVLPRAVRRVQVPLNRFRP